MAIYGLQCWIMRADWGLILSKTVRSNVEDKILGYSEIRLMMCQMYSYKTRKWDGGIIELMVEEALERDVLCFGYIVHNDALDES